MILSARPRRRPCLARETFGAGVASAAKTAVALALIAASFWILPRVAQHQFTSRLREEGAHALALAATGDTPYKWSSRPADVIAGQVFGAADFDFAKECLLVQAGAQPFEIGVTVSHAVPLREFARLHLFAYATAPTQVRIVARETLDGDEWVSAPFALAGISKPTELELDQLAWQTRARSGVHFPPAAAMLRFRFEMPAGGKLEYDGAQLDRAATLPRLTLMPPEVAQYGGTPTKVHELPVEADALEGELARLAASTIGQAPPVVLLPEAGRVEQQALALRAIRRRLPAAIVLPKEHYNVAFAQASKLLSEEPDTNKSTIAWIAISIYALLIGGARLRPPRNARMRALVELALVLAGPMWLIVGGHFSGRVDLMQAVLIAATTIYAITLALPRTWRWNGTACAWMLATVVVLAAFGMGILFHRAGLRPIGSGHVIRYFGWALVQQYLICAVCLERFRIVTGSAAASVYLSALCFALLHTPNSTLMLATFAGGLCWGWLYSRERALLPLAYSHAASALVLIALLPPEILLSAEVSARFFQ